MNNYKPIHDSADLLKKAGFRQTAHGCVKDLNSDIRLHALINCGKIEMHVDKYEPFIRANKKRKHTSTKVYSQINNEIQKLRNIDNLRFYNAYQE